MNQAKLLRALLVLMICLTATIVGLYSLSTSTTMQVFGDHIHHVATDRKVVALTFDDAPLDNTEHTLAVLAEKQIPATFFVVGKHIEERPETAQRIVAAGHQLANHSYSHPRFLFKSQAAIDTEVTRTNQLIRQSGFTGEIVFRPPYGKRLLGLPLYLRRHDITTVMWSIDPDTHHGPDAAEMYNYTIKNTQPGSIILLHPDCPSGCEADQEILPKLIDKLRYQGYQFVTVNQLRNLTGE